ncbi:hypothetical protein ACUN0C_04750 [Faunimonas sp. B44]|uniref:hypothetical protein n=1 Tax=Faunimonas sp. B44 TaxID=3461493 RepID=UPI0040441C76
MTDRSSAAAEPLFIILRCPACGAAEPVEPDMVGTAVHMIVCRKCGEAWPARESSGNPGAPDGAAGPEQPRDEPVLQAVRRPLVAYAVGGPDPWAAKLAADTPRADARTPAGGLGIGLATIGVLFLAGMLLARPALVGILPDLAGLYGAIGLPVNLDGLEMRAVSSERARTGSSADQIVVRGTIANPGGRERTVAGVVVTVRDTGRDPILARSFDAPIKHLAAGRSAAFEFSVDDVPRQAHDVVLRFRP